MHYTCRMILFEISMKLTENIRLNITGENIYGFLDFLIFMLFNG